MNLTVQDLGQAVIFVGSVCLALIAIGTVAHFLVVRPSRNWAVIQMRTIAATLLKPAQETADQLRTTNGHTIGEILERTAVSVAEVRDELRSTNDLTLRNQVMSLENARRIDDHLVKGHEI